MNKSQGDKHVSEEIKTFLIRFFVLAAMLFIIFGVVFGVMPMKNNDMVPRISAGDILLYYRLGWGYENQDVVVLPEYVGRIVARGGDTVEITEDSELKINDSIVVENDIYYRTPPYEGGISYPVTLKEDEYFVLCDFREGAKDSRYLGPVKEEEIKGKVITIIRRSGL